MELSVDQLTEEVQGFINEKHQIYVPAERIRGLAIAALKEAGRLSKEDRYKTYEHVGRVQRLFNDAFGEGTLSWEDVENFTGNLYYAMRVATSRPFAEIEKLKEKYGGKREISAEEVRQDLADLEDICRRNMTDTWRYLENTQLTGVGAIIAKVIKSALLKKNTGEK